MAVRASAEQIAAKQAERLKASLEYIRTGVNNVTVAPSAKAVAKSDKWHNAVSSQDALLRYKTNLGKVTLEQWKSDMLNKGINRIPAGIDAAKDKVVAYYNRAIPHMNSGLTKLESMPDQTLTDSIARMTYWVNHMAQMPVK